MLTGICEGAWPAAAIHLLAVSGVTASERGRADPENPARPESARGGVGSHSTEGGHHRYRHYRAIAANENVFAPVIAAALRC
jgi:hypothetical protein